jgi:hypothetical protein
MHQARDNAWGDYIHKVRHMLRTFRTVRQVLSPKPLTLSVEVQRVASLQMHEAGGTNNSTLSFHEQDSMVEVDRIYVDNLQLSNQVN